MTFTKEEFDQLTSVVMGAVRMHNALFKRFEQLAIEHKGGDMETQINLSELPDCLDALKEMVTECQKKEFQGMTERLIGLFHLAGLCKDPDCIYEYPAKN